MCIIIPNPELVNDLELAFIISLDGRYNGILKNTEYGRLTFLFDYSDIVNFQLIDSDGTRRMSSIILPWS
jgi:hypothetical protein